MYFEIDAAVMNALKIGNLEDVQKNVIDKFGADFYICTREMKALLFACYNDLSYEVIELLLQKGATVDASCHTTGHTALHYAARNGNHRVCRLLLRYGADPNKINEKEKESPMHYGVQNLEVLKVLFENGAELSDSDKQRILCEAVARRASCEVLEFLIHKGACVNKTGNYGKTALYVAAIENKDPKTCEFLIKYGADPTQGKVVDHVTNEKCKEIIEKSRPLYISDYRGRAHELNEFIRVREWMIGAPRFPPY